MRTLLPVTLVAAALVAGPLALPASAADDERIDRSTTTLTVHRDGSLGVREEIVYDFGDQGHHGLEREIPVRAPHDRDHDRSYPVRDLRVSSPTGANTQVHTETDGGVLDVRVGDPDHDDVTGRQTYVLTYTVPAVVDTAADGSLRVAWNAVGTSWDVPVENASATIEAPVALSDQRCVQGGPGSTRPCDGTRLDPGQGLTVSARMAAGAITPAPPLLVRTFSPARAFTPSRGSLGGAAVVLFAGGAFLLTRRRHRPGPSPAPLDVLAVPPGVLGAVVHGGARDVDVVATLLDLARRGHLTLAEELDDHGDVHDWRLHRRDSADPLSAAERRLLGTVFEDGPDTSLADVRTTARAGTQLTKDELEDDAVAHGLFTDRPRRLVLRRVGRALLVVLAGVAATVLLAWWTPYGLVGVALVLVGLVLAVVGLLATSPLTDRGRQARERATAFASGLTRLATADRSTRLVPYAVALDATSAWAAGARLLGTPVPAPDWYTGRASDGSTVNVGLFAGTMGGFSASTSDALTAAPPTTGASGASSGATFTGGAAGGGGGGSW